MLDGSRTITGIDLESLQGVRIVLSGLGLDLNLKYDAGRLFDLN